jgi:hypothetical protein
VVQMNLEWKEKNKEKIGRKKHKKTTLEKIEK